MAAAPTDDEADRDARQTLLQIEGKFSERLGTSEKCCGRRVSLGVGVQIIAVLALASILNHTLTSIARTGAPCYYWWKHWATTVTFAAGHAIRLLVVPHAVCGLVGARKGEERGPRLFFFCLLGLAGCCALDVVLCVFEVSEVCSSAELIEWNRCSHEWGTNQYQCTAIGGSAIDPDQPARCAVVPQQENEGETGAGAQDFDACADVVGCQHVLTPESEWAVPACCTNEDWSHDSGPCSREPIERPAAYDVSRCELISDLYDVGLNLIWVAMLIWFAYVVNSYRVAVAGSSGGGSPTAAGLDGGSGSRGGESESETVATVVAADPSKRP
jgi:hypothetical protein